MGTENSKLLGKDNSFDSKIDDVPGNTILLTLKSSFKYVGSSAFMPDLSNQRNEDIRNTWSKQHRPPEEYERAVRSIILESFWLPHTRIIRHLNDIKKVIRANPSMESSLMNDFTQILHSAIKKAYPKCSNPSKMRDIFTNCNISEVVVKCYNNSGWRKPFFAYSLRKITETEPQDTIVAKLSEICDRAHRCLSAQRQAFTVLVSASLRGDGGRESNDLSTREGALARFYECMEDYLDDHKERAFKSSFIEPARFYYQATNNNFGKDHVDVHGINWYLALLHSTLSVQLPYLSAMSDPDIIGVVDFWQGLNDAAWTHFSDPLYFGVNFEGIKAFKNSASFVREPVPDGMFPVNNRSPTPKQLANAAVDPSTAPAACSLRSKVAIYLERFAFFFSRDFFIRRSFETMNSEMKPEHAGFRKAAETLYGHYKTEFGCSEETVIEYCYSDDMFTQFNTSNAEKFYAWLDIVKKAESTEGKAVSAETDPNIDHNSSNTIVHKKSRPLREVSQFECPICFEHKSDIELVHREEENSSSHHSSELRGDLSSHRMCRDCRALYDKDQCPFCKEPMQQLTPLVDAGEAVFATHMVEYFHKKHQTINKDPTYCAAAIEEWQMFEMTCNDSNSSIAVSRAAQLLLQNPTFLALMRRGVSSDQPFLRDAAGLFFRLYGMYVHDELLEDIPPSSAKLIVEVVEAIIVPLEQQPPLSLHGHNLGALYQQALSAWLCAWTTSSSPRVQVQAHTTGALSILVRRVGHVLLHYLRGKCSPRDKQQFRREVMERMYREVAELAQQSIWGSAEEDVVFQQIIKP